MPSGADIKRVAYAGPAAPSPNTSQLEVWDVKGGSFPRVQIRVNQPFAYDGLVQYRGVVNLTREEVVKLAMELLVLYG